MKPRSDSTLKTLPAERQAGIAEYLSAHSLAETRDWLKADGVQTSITSLSDFGCWYALQRQLTRNEQTVETLLGEFVKANPNVSPEKIQAMGQAFFSALALANQDPDAWVSVQNLNLKRQQIALDREKFELLRKKAEAFEQVKAAVNSGGVTPETLLKIERELKLL